MEAETLSAGILEGYATHPVVDRIEERLTAIASMAVGCRPPGWILVAPSQRLLAHKTGRTGSVQVVVLRRHTAQGPNREVIPYTRRGPSAGPGR